MKTIKKHSISFCVFVFIGLVTTTTFGQNTSDLKISISEVYVKKNKPKRTWIELKIDASKLDEKVAPELFLSTKKAKLGKAPIMFKLGKKFKGGKVHYVTLSTKTTYHPFPLREAGFIDSLNLVPGDTLYLSSKVEEDSLLLLHQMFLDSNKITEDDKYLTYIIPSDLRKMNKVFKSKAVTKNAENLFWNTSYSRKYSALHLGIGLGDGKFRSTNSPSNITPTISYDMGVFREKKMFFNWMRFRYGIQYNLVNFNFNNSTEEVLTKIEAGEEKKTIREISSNGKSRGRRVGIPLGLTARVTNDFSVHVGTTLSLGGTVGQVYSAEITYTDSLTNTFIRTEKFPPEHLTTYINSSWGWNVELQYHWKERHQLYAKFVRYNTGANRDSATGKANVHFGFFMGYQFCYGLRKKRIPQSTLFR